MHHMKDQQSWSDWKLFYMTFFLKMGECMNDIYVIWILYYKLLVWILWSKSSSFYGNKPPMHTCNIAGILIEIIYIKGIFLNDYNDVMFTWIICTMNRTIGHKGLRLILTSLRLGMINMSLHQQCHDFILDSLDLIATIYGYRLILPFISMMAGFVPTYAICYFAVKHEGKYLWTFFSLVVHWKTIYHTSLLHWCNGCPFFSIWANPSNLFLKQTFSIDTYGHIFLCCKGFLQYHQPYCFYHIPVLCRPLLQNTITFHWWPWSETQLH